MMNKKLMRSNNKMVAGVCAGIGEYLDIDPTVIRAAYALLLCLTAVVPLLIAYIALCVIMPQQ